MSPKKFQFFMRIPGVNSKIALELMSSHLLEDVEELCDYIIIVHAGEAVYTGALVEFKKNFKTLEEAYSQFKIDFTGGLNL